MNPPDPGDARVRLHPSGRPSEPHRRFLIPNRFGYRWRHFNHRVALWGFHLDQNRSHPWADHLTARAAGGPFSTGLGPVEQPLLRFGYQRVDTGTDEATAAARCDIETTIGPDGADRGTFLLDRAELGLEHCDDVTAMLVGFEFDTDIPQPGHFPDAYDPAHGYTTRGLGVDVEVTAIDDGAISLDYWVRFGFGAAMDRPYHNEALLDARVGVEVHVALVGSSDRPIRTGSADYLLEDGEPKIGVDRPVPSVSDERARIELLGEPRAPAGLMGLQGFDFDLTPDRSCEWNRGWPMGDEFRGERGGHPDYGPPGVYLRELTVDLTRHRYDRDTGEARFSLDGFASNATHSIPFHPFRSRFRGRMAWLQIEGAGPPIQFDSPFAPRQRSFPLADME